MTTESGRIATSSSRRRVETLLVDRTVPLLSQACLFCLSLCLLDLSHSQSYFRQCLFSARSAGRELVCLCHKSGPWPILQAAVAE